MREMPTGDRPPPWPVPAAPDWFHDALATPHERYRIEVDGCPVEALAWGERGLPGLLFVHGMLAHARWWSFIAPLLADRFRCVALSLSGMGHSGWREQYSINRYVDELGAVIDMTGLRDGRRKPVLVAHSFGSFAARRFAQCRPHALSGLVLLDAPIRATDAYVPSRPLRPYLLKPYASIEAAVDSFRLLPAQDCANPALVAHVAATGLRERGGHWYRSFDPEVRLRMSREDYHAALPQMDGPLAFAWGERSALLSAEARQVVQARYPDAPWIEIADAAHHVMLDQPLALVEALRGLLEAWPEPGFANG